MTLARFSCVVLAVCAVLGAGGCATSAQHVEPYRDIACFGRAKIPLTEAIATAERAQGETVIDAEYNCDEELACVRGDPGQYRITFFANGKLHRVGICPETGQVQEAVEKGALKRLLDLDFLFDWPESEMLRGGPAAATAPITMQAAIATAETRGGKAMAAHVKTEDGKTNYVIEVVDGGRLRVVSVDLNDGRLLNSGGE